MGPATPRQVLVGRTKKKENKSKGVPYANEEKGKGKFDTATGGGKREEGGKGNKTRLTGHPRVPCLAASAGMLGCWAAWMLACWHAGVSSALAAATITVTFAAADKPEQATLHRAGMLTPQARPP